VLELVIFSLDPYRITWNTDQRRTCDLCDRSEYPFCADVSDRGNTVTDYRERDDHVVSKMQKLLHGKALMHSFNTVSERGSSINLSLVLAQNSKLNLVLLYLIEGIPDHIERLTTTAESLWKFPLQGSVRDNAAKGRLGLGSGEKSSASSSPSLMADCWMKAGSKFTAQGARSMVSRRGNCTEGSPRRQGLGGEFCDS